ncbi:MAG: SPOR domain-containing protein [Alphaproteobacteria bacterium]|nr:SPOR domain-containing protein [Alphaproteobacteria bacterium]
MNDDKNFFGSDSDNFDSVLPQQQEHEPAISQSGIEYGEGECMTQQSSRSIIIAVGAGVVIAVAALVALRSGKDKGDKELFTPASRTTVEDRFEAEQPSEIDSVLAQVAAENARADIVRPAPVLAAPEPAAAPAAPAAPVAKPTPVRTLPAAAPVRLERGPSIYGEQVDSREAAAAIRSAPVVARAATPAVAGGFFVQLVSVSDAAKAEAEWASLQRKHPSVFGGRQHVIQKADVGGRAVYRLRVAGFATSAEATTFCNQLKAYNLSCLVAR